jgi:hypothetical protein
MASDDVARLIGLIKEPFWKLWVSRGKREAAAQELVKLGKAAVPALIREYQQDPKDRGLLYQSLIKLGEASAPVLAEMAEKTTDPAEMQRLAAVFEEMGPPARAAIPLLLKWAKLRKDPRREMMRHLTGDAALDRGIAERVGIAAEDPMEAMVFTCVRQAAAGALIKMGPGLPPYVSELQSLQKNEPDEICRDRLGRAIKAAGA